MFVFGHAFDPQKVIGTMEDVKLMQDFMEKLEAYVSGAVKAGKTKDEIMAVTAIPWCNRMAGRWNTKGDTIGL